jgi:hypothetical protein
MSQSINSLLFEIKSDEKLDQNPKLLRVILTKEYTRIDFGYTTPWYYEKGGWINISPNSYLKLDDADKKYHLKNAIGVPFAPNQTDFQSIEDWQFFTLYFEPIPQKDCILNMIEAIDPTPDDFNYYGICLNINQGVKIC